MMSLNYLTVHIHCQIFKIYQVLDKKHKTLSTNPTIHIYINEFNKKLVLKICDEYKLQLQTSETMKLLASTKN